MRIWKQPISVELLTASNANSAVTHLGIEFLEVGDDFIRARVPVDRRTVQPYGLLHGGVSVVLAETLGSAARPTRRLRGTAPSGWTSTPTTSKARPAAGSPASHARCT
jgi:acyl-coenzyme A thioesterase PaaI-like protein